MKKIPSKSKISQESIEIYKVWAPDGADWTEFAKPVLFADMRKRLYYDLELTVPQLSWMSELSFSTMIIVDLPNVRGVEESLALARLGYRPIPLYNGVKGPKECYTVAVDVNDLELSLQCGAETLKTINIKSNAPPVFMLDQRRMKDNAKMPGSYDNRWCVFPQDMPSAFYLIKKGIKKIIVRSDSYQNDLLHILYRYQEAGIKIFRCGNDGIVKEAAAAKPSRFKSFFYRLSVTMGLKRNAAGGFGGEIPDPMNGGTHGGYYGYG